MLQRSSTAVELGEDTSVSQTTNVKRDSLIGRAKTLRNRIGARLNQRGLQHRDFSILSNDCWAWELYKDWRVPCRTPFRGLGMPPEAFLRFLGDIERYVKEPLRFISHSKHVSVNRIGRQQGWLFGLIGEELEVYFVHYANEEEARQAWEEGCRTINLNRIAVKFSADKDGARLEHIEQFCKLPFERKLVLTKRAYRAIPCAVKVSRFESDGGRMFRRSLRDFDCAHWLNTGEIRRHTLRVFINKLLYLRGV